MSSWVLYKKDKYEINDLTLPWKSLNNRYYVNVETGEKIVVDDSGMVGIWDKEQSLWVKLQDPTTTSKGKK